MYDAAKRVAAVGTKFGGQTGKGAFGFRSIFTTTQSVRHGCCQEREKPTVTWFNLGVMTGKTTTFE